MMGCISYLLDFFISWFLDFLTSCILHFFYVWCPERDSNSHTLRYTPLKRTCLPKFHHPGMFFSADFADKRGFFCQLSTNICATCLPAGRSAGNNKLLIFQILFTYAIRNAVSAASLPLFPCFPPALAAACLKLFVVRTPKITGIPNCNPTFIIPCATAELI